MVAVAGLTFSVAEGEIFGLLGPNGAGKTSTIEVLEGLESPDEGRVHVLGLDITTSSAQVKERIGVQLQSTGLPRYLTVAETVDLFASFYRRGHERLDWDPIERLGLHALRSRVNSRLSGGERQRVALALALINNPQLLFLDEPSNGLDPHGRRELWAVIREWQSGGRTVVLTTHDMHEAEALCDRVGIMDAGQIVALGTVPELINEQESEEAIWVQAGRAALPAELASTLPGVARVLAERDGLLLYSDDAAATTGSLLALRASGELSFDSVQVRRASLEDVFLSRTGRRLES